MGFSTFGGRGFLCMSTLGGSSFLWTGDGRGFLYIGIDGGSGFL